MDRLGMLYDQHGPRTFRYLLALLGDRAEAEDALQAAFLELARRPDILERVESPAAYLLVSARHAALRGRRRAERRRQQEAIAAPRILEACDAALHDESETVRLEKALLTLPVEQREVLVLKVYEDLTFQQIAEALAISPNTAASRYRYAIDKLRHLLGDGS